MSSLLYLALSNAVVATLLAVFVAVVARFCRRPAVRHVLWLLVLLKLITPPIVPLSVTLPRSEESEPQPASFIPPEPDTSEPTPLLPESTPPIEAATVRERLSEALPLPYGRGSVFPLALIIAWLSGTLVLWTVAVVRLRRFRRLLRQAQPAAADVQEQGRRLAALLGLRRCPPIVFVTAPLSPLLWALGFLPRLLVPAGLWRKLTTEQQDTLLAHELAHLRRGDHWVRRLELLVLGLYWWHPVVWWTRRRLQEAEEECCDALVVAVLPDAAPAYAAALVETVAFLSQTRPAALLGASGAGHVPLLKRRLTMILSQTSARKPSRIGFWTVLGLGALLLPLAPQMGQTQAPEKSKQTGSNDQVGMPSITAWVENFHDHEFIKARDCAACHVVPMAGHDLHDKPQSWQDAHDEIVRLLDEIKTRRSQLQETEDRLKRALSSLKKLEPRSEWPDLPPQFGSPRQATSWGITWAEALFDRRTVDLPVRKRPIPERFKFVMTNHGQYLIHLDSIRTSSGCLSATATKDELKPGETAAIEARLDTSKIVGQKTLQIFVQFDKPDRKQVVLEIRVNNPAASPAKPQSPQRLQELEKKLDELRKEMDNLRREVRPDKPRTPGRMHNEAQGFIDRVWPTLGLSRLEENIPKARKALQMCKTDGDLRSLRKLLKGAYGHLDRMGNELARLHPELVIEDEKEVLKLKKVNEQLVELAWDIENYLKAHPDDK